MYEDTKAPSTVKELGIELQGFKEVVNLKFDTLTTEITRLTKTLEDIVKAKADQEDLEALGRRVKSLETRRPWNAVILSSTFTAVFTAVVLYVVNDLINGGK